MQNFLGGPDEEHFRLVHVEIEAKAGPAVALLMPMVQAANAERSLSTSSSSSASAVAKLSSASTPSSDDLASPNYNGISAEDQVEAGLVVVASALRTMQASLSRMGEKCDPYIYYHRVRLPMSGWRSNPALPEVPMSMWWQGINSLWTDCTRSCISYPCGIADLLTSSHVCLSSGPSV